MIPYGQHFGAMAAPVAEMERMLLARTLQHGGIRCWRGARRTRLWCRMRTGTGVNGQGEIDGTSRRCSGC